MVYVTKSLLLLVENYTLLTELQLPYHWELMSFKLQEG